MGQVVVFLCALFFSSYTLRSVEKAEKISIKKKKKKWRFKSITQQKVNKYVKNLFEDSYNIHENLFSLTSMRVLTAVVPFYLVSRRTDAKVHEQFYTKATHTNRNQPPKMLKVLGDEFIAVPFFALGALGLIYPDDEFRRSCQLFSAGAIWVWASKVLIKRIKVDANLRPWHEEFDRHKKMHGGNPSGHVSTAVYLAWYWGLERGIKWGLPLGLYSIYVGGISVARNHHYFSQIIAGSGLGMLYAFAAHNTFKKIKEKTDFDFGFGPDERGRFSLKIACDF